MALEVADERRREVAIGLLARINGEIVAEHVERLLGDADGAAVAGRADHARAGEPRHHALDAFIHRAGLDDLVADQPSFRAVAVEPTFVLDGLARDAIAGEA